jgi:predicted amidohydrolase YtcJ
VPPVKGLAISTTLTGRSDDARLLTAEQYLRCYTAGSAFTVGRNDLGHLHPGASADIVVFDKDPLTTTAAEAAAIKVTRSWVNGVQVDTQLLAQTLDISAWPPFSIPIP